MIESIKTLYIADFGAIGDGITDDGNAILKACLELKNCPAGTQLIFESNKTYFVSDLNNLTDAAFYFQNLSNITIKGDNTTILLDKDRRYIGMNFCDNITIQGFNFDLKVRAHFVGKIEDINLENGYFDILSDRDFGFYDEFIPSKPIFGLTDVGGTSREYIVINKISTLDKSSLRYRIFPDMGETGLGRALGSAAHVEALDIGFKVILPTPEIGHYGANMINIHDNENVHFKDINVWNSREFVWVLRNNKGTVTFDNVNVMPPKDEEVAFSSWRDCFHCKKNSAPITWNNCTFIGHGDDIFNISCDMMYIDKIIGKKEVVCYFTQLNGASYGNIDVGDTLMIWDCDTGELIGKTSIEEVVDKATNRYILADELPNLKAGKNIKFSFDSLSAPNSKIVNCNLDGTFRFRGGPVTVENCDIRLITMWLEWEGSWEGPIPHDIAFNDCRFNVVGGSEAFRINAFNPIVMWREGLYRLENISFNNCTGLKKANFQNQRVFTEGSTDYIKFQPAVTE